ncbi:MAG TPA: acyl-CoA dehydrogenase family protein [candidate division Zixibacteria bacterium]|nr:acyl-CoA dehydrogenase family protein [candidate division Zixibacteria bacterium]
MTYLTTPEHDELRAVVRELAEERIAPRASEIDQSAEFPWDLKELLAGQDLLGTCFEERHGGTNLDSVAQSIVIEEIARADATTSLIPIVQKLGALPILLAGTDDQKDRYLPRLASGEWLAAFGLTEAAAGSDVASNRMRARREGDCYVLNGSKRFITHGSVANLVTVFALTDPDAGGRKGMSAFIVETDTPGFSAPRLEHKMGIRGSPTAELNFDDVRVPIENRLGEEGDGFKIAMATLDRSRLGIAAQAVGIAQGALDAALRYAADRQQFGQRVVDFQGIQFMLADMASQTEAARQLVYAASARVDANASDLPYWTSSAKLVAGDTAMRVTTDAVQVLGGYGYITEYPVERMMRDAKITQLYEGTQQIQRLVIARQLLQRAGIPVRQPRENA